jgi:hypothetical protein
MLLKMRVMNWSHFVAHFNHAWSGGKVSFWHLCFALRFVWGFVGGFEMYFNFTNASLAQMTTLAFLTIITSNLSAKS